MIKAILFDMDGVLVDAKEWHYLALNKALEVFGLPIAHDEHLSTYDGLPTREKLKILTKKHGFPLALHDFTNALKQDYTFDICVQECHPIFHIEYCLSRLKKEGYLIAVCSNSIRPTVELMMRKSALSPYLDLIVSNQDVKRGKPDPEMYLKAMDFFKVDPSEALICEDNENGIRAAIASGGNLLKINTIEDTNYYNIKNKIRQLNKEGE